MSYFFEIAQQMQSYKLRTKPPRKVTDNKLFNTIPEPYLLLKKLHIYSCTKNLIYLGQECEYLAYSNFGETPLPETAIHLH